MITTSPAAVFVAVYEKAAPGLVGTLTFGVLKLPTAADPDGTLVIPETTDGIQEFPQLDGTSTYEATRMMPADAVLGAEYETAWPDDLVQEQEQIEVIGATAELSPSIDDVATKVLARTRTPSGRGTGTFTDVTNPTATQVQRMIDAVAVRVLATVGPGFDSGRVIGQDLAGDDLTLGDLVRDTIAAGAAAQVELSLEPESASSADSAYNQLRQEFLDGLQLLRDSDTTDPEDRQGFGSMLVASPTATGYGWELNEATWPPDAAHT